jgi:hypothetical protein
MGWCTTFDLDRFAAAAGGYLRSRAAENTLLLSAAQAALAARESRAGWRPQVAGQHPGTAAPGLLCGWWEPPDGGEPRGAFVHDPPVPLLIAGKAPEMAAALAATLAKMGRQVSGVDAPTEVADAFAAAWSQRTGTSVRAHKNCRVYRLPVVQKPVVQRPAAQGPSWPSPEVPDPVGWLRVAAAEDQALLADWLTAFATETAERISAPADLAAELIGYGGAVFWEVPHKPSQLRDAAHHLPLPRHRDAQPAEPVHQPVALATLTRPVARTVRISMLYTPPERRHGGYATALTQAVSRTALTGCVSQVVMIADKNQPDRWVGRLGYQLIGERAVLRFGPVTGPMPRAQPSGAMPRLPTGPLPRLPRLPH